MDAPYTSRKLPGPAAHSGRWPWVLWWSLPRPAGGSSLSPVGWWRWPESHQPAGREEGQKQISKSESNWQCKEEKSRKASTLYHFTSSSSRGNERTVLWPVCGDTAKLSCSQSVSGLVSAGDVKSVSQTGLHRVNPAITKMAKLINSFGRQKWSQMGQWGAPRERARKRCLLSFTGWS